MESKHEIYPRIGLLDGVSLISHQTSLDVVSRRVEVVLSPASFLCEDIFNEKHAEPNEHEIYEESDDSLRSISTNNQTKHQITLLTCFHLRSNRRVALP